jgi:hypothetical protein
MLQTLAAGPNPVRKITVKTLYVYKATKIRADYSAHVLRSMFQGFKPLSLAGFVAVAAPAYIANLGA